MKTTLRRAASFLAVLAAALGLATLAWATVDYGNFSGTNFDFTSVQETTTTGGDPEPLAGTPSLFGDDLVVFASAFDAAASGASGFDVTGTNFGFVLTATGGATIDEIEFTVTGDTTLAGLGVANSGVGASGTVTILETTSGPIAPVNVPFSLVFLPDIFTLPGDLGTTPFSGAATVDVSASVADATVASLNFDVDIVATSESGTSAAIDILSIAIAPSAPPVVTLTPPFVAQPNITHSLDGPALGDVADVDGDGDMDFFSRGVNDMQLTWYENDGTGSFTENLIGSTTGTSTVALAGDVDGDGDVDWVVTEQSPSQVSWWDNTSGDGSTWMNRLVALGYALTVSSPADVDGDGDLDLLAADAGLSALFWYDNQDGSGTSWSAANPIAGITGPNTILPADIDGDGHLDALVSAPYSNSTIAWYRNDAGDGSSWTLNTVSSVAPNVVGVLNEDFDGDGDQDIVAANSGGTGVTWYENLNGAGTSWTPHTINNTVSQPNVPFPQDVDSDGDVDVLLAALGGTLAWYENTDGTGTSWTEHVLATNAPGAIALAAFDYDSDGDLDPAAVVRDDDTIRIWRNETIHRSSVVGPGQLVSNTQSAPGFSRPADMDGDGDQDMTVASSGDGTIAYYESTAGDGSAWSRSNISVNPGDLPFHWTANPDGDGDLDVLDVDSLAGQVVWWDNTAGDASSFTRRVIGNTISGYAFPADIDGDGDEDVYHADNSLVWYANTAGDGSTWSAPTSIGARTTLLAVHVDMDRDGDLDVVATESLVPSGVYWFENTSGDGASWTEHTVDASASTINVALAIPEDVDGDGDADVVVALAGDGIIRWYENANGAGTSWTPHTIALDALTPQTALPIDFDADGDVDVVVHEPAGGGPTGRTRWYENTAGDGSAWSPHILGSAVTGLTASIVFETDLNGDTLTDLVQSRTSDNSVIWYPNRGGQYAITTTATAPATILGIDDVLRFDVDHRGRSGDHDVELTGIELLFEDGGATPLTSTQLSDFLASLRIYRDDGSGSFEAGSDTLIANVGSFALTAGVLSVTFTDGDPNVQVPFGTTETYFVVLEPEATFGAQAPSQVQVTHLTESSSSAEDAFFDTPLTQEYAPDTPSGVFSTLEPSGDPDGDGLTNSQETNTGVFVDGNDTGSDPNDADTDDDGFDDGREVELGTDPNTAEAAEGPFVTALPVATLGTGHISRGLGDIDSDGDLDAILATTTQVLVYANDAGDGSSWTQTVVATVPNLSSVGTADIDRDGDLDVLYGSETVVWAENADGTGTSWLPNTLYTGGVSDFIGAVVAADVDGDGDLDVLSGDTDDVRWHENTAGDGSAWTTQPNIDSIDSPTWIVAADVDRDGDLDAVVATSGSDDRIRWYENVLGDGSSWTGRDIATGLISAASVAVSDVDRDGDPDVVGVWGNSDRVAWYENTGGGLSWTPHDIDVSAGTPTSVETRDMDNDGDVDVLAALGGDGFTWYENTSGDGSSFAKRSLSAAANGAFWLVGGDINGDGNVDAMGGELLTNSVQWIRSLAIHRSAAAGPSHVITTTQIGPTFGRPADGDRDGDPDVTLASNGDNSLTYYSNTAGDGTAWGSITLSAAPGDSPVHGNVDLDGDDDIDVLALDSAAAQLVWWENLFGNATGVQRNVIGSVTGAGIPVAADLDRDGDQDVYYADQAVGLLWFENLGGAASWGPATPLNATFTVLALHADVDGDGDLDLVGSVGVAPGALYWYENTAGDASSFTQRTIDATASPTGIAVGVPSDMDGDGDIDVVAGLLTDDTIAWYENTAGDGSSWTPHTVATDASFLNSVVPIDVDLDGDLDIVSNEQGSGGPTGRVRMFENTVGDASIWSVSSLVSGVTGLSQTVIFDVDINRDAAPDMIQTFGNTAVWIENGGGQLALTTTSTAPAALVGGSVDDYLRIDLDHRGRAGDNDAELASLELRFEDGAGTPLSTAAANALVDAVEIHLDDGSGSFEDGVDTLVASVPTLALDGSGVQTVTFTDGDPLVRVVHAGSKRYFVVLELQAAAGGSLELVHVTESGSSGEDAQFDLPLLLEYAPNVTTGPIVDGSADTDGDGVTDADELSNGTSITDPDSDDDGLCDGSIDVGLECVGGEVLYGTNPLLSDSDSDGLDDLAEVELGTIPTNPDTDADTVNDGGDNCPFVDNGGQANGDAFPAGDDCQCGDLDGDGDIDATDVSIARLAFVARSDTPGHDATRCNVVGPSDGGVSDCNLNDIALLRRIVNGTAGAAPGDVCQAFNP